MIESSAEYARVIANYPLVFLPDRNPRVEDMRFPPMRRLFRAEHERLGRPPRLTEFVRVCGANWPGAFPVALEVPIEARLARAYASLVREEHFGLLLREICEPAGLRVLDSDALDMAGGIDYAVIRNGRTIGIAVRQATRRAWAFDGRKAWRRYVGWDIVTAELDAENRIECGRFWLFESSWVQRFVERSIL